MGISIVESPENLDSSEESLSVVRPGTALKVIKEWNPPLLGELPSTFLKVDGMPAAKSNKVIYLIFNFVFQEKYDFVLSLLLI